MADYHRPLSETLIEMETNVRKEFDVDFVLIQNGAFYEAYLHSAEFLKLVMGYQTSTNAWKILMSGVPPRLLKSCIETTEAQGNKVAVVEQVAKARTRMLREVKYVTRHPVLHINNLVIEYGPE